MEQQMQAWPVGVHDFAELRTQGLPYVDKTELMGRFANGHTFSYMGRPRRFGNSLFLSALRCYFEGRGDLFKGLAAEKLEEQKGDQAWRPQPLLYLEMDKRSKESG